MSPPHTACHDIFRLTGHPKIKTMNASIYKRSNSRRAAAAFEPFEWGADLPLGWPFDGADNGQGDAVSEAHPGAGFPPAREARKSADEVKRIAW
jgi:hypothetical protein